MGLREVEDEQEFSLNYVKDHGITKAVNVCMSNSLGFGGHNVALIVRKYREWSSDYRYSADPSWKREGNTGWNNDSRDDAPEYEWSRCNQRCYDVRKNYWSSCKKRTGEGCTVNRAGEIQKRWKAGIWNGLGWKKWIQWIHINHSFRSCRNRFRFLTISFNSQQRAGKKFWLLEEYRIRSKEGIERLVNLGWPGINEFFLTNFHIFSDNRNKIPMGKIGIKAYTIAMQENDAKEEQERKHEF